MLEGMIDAARGCLKEEMRMDVIANNLSNSNVIGYKKHRISFQDLLDGIGEGGAQTGGKGSGPLDSSLVATKIDFDQGDLRFTGNTLDFALYGSGFFKIDTPDGIRYTRKGNFRLDSGGFLVTQAGQKVMGKGGHMKIDILGVNVNVDGDGVISVDGSEAGQIDVTDFEDYGNLVKQGDGLFRNNSEDSETAAPPHTKIEQGSLEGSNVNVAEEIVQMIHSLRAFESYQKAIQVIDAINKRAINEVSRLR